MPSQLIAPQTWRYSGTFCIVIDYHHQYATERVILHWWLEIFDVIDNFGFFPRLEELFSSIITRVYESLLLLLTISRDFQEMSCYLSRFPQLPQVCLRRLVGNYQDTNHILLLQSVWPGGRKNNLADPSETILKCLILSWLLANNFNDKSLSVWVSTEGTGARCLLSVCSNLHNTSLKGQKLNDYISKKPLLNRNKELWLDCRMVNNLSYCHHILVKISKKKLPRWSIRDLCSSRSILYCAIFSPSPEWGDSKLSQDIKLLIMRAHSDIYCDQSCLFNVAIRFDWLLFSVWTIFIIVRCQLQLQQVSVFNKQDWRCPCSV